jgi:hypothetical protein
VAIFEGEISLAARNVLRKQADDGTHCGMLYHRIYHESFEGLAPDGVYFRRKDGILTKRKEAKEQKKTEKSQIRS